MALTDKLTAIADATRAKTGTTNQMTLDEIAKVTTNKIAETTSIFAFTHRLPINTNNII